MRVDVEDIIYILVLVIIPTAVIACVILMELHSVPYRFFIYGLWMFGITIISHWLLKINECVLNSPLCEVLSCIAVVFCIWPILVVIIMIFESDSISFVIRPPKYKFSIVQSSEEVEHWVCENCVGFFPLRPIVSDRHVFIFRDRDFVKMKLFGLLGEKK